MPAQMMRFVSVGQRTPDKRPAEERTHDFREIYGRFTPEGAA